MSALPQWEAGGAAPRLRVLHLSGSNVRGGAEEHMLTLLRGLDRKRFQLYLACTPALLPQLSDRPADVRVEPCAPRKPWQAGTGWRLCRWLQAEHIDLVHAHLSFASRAAAPWVKLARGPLLLETPHVSENWRRGWKRAAWLDHAAGGLVDGYIAVSDANADYLGRQRGLPVRKIHTIRNGVDVARFDRSPRHPSDPRASLGVAPGEMLLVCVARLEPQKGHAVLLEAVARLPRGRGPKLRLVCLGDGRLRSALQLQAQQLGLADTVLFPGYCPQIEAWLAVADIFVLPSMYEGLPLSVMEAAAAGCAIVATAVDGTPELLADGRDGLLVPPGHPEALAQALLRLIADAGLRKALGEHARQRAREEFDQAHQIAATSTLYVELGNARAAQRGRVPADPCLPPTAVGGERG